MAWLVKCLPHKHGDLSSDPWGSYKDPGKAAHAYNPRAGGAETGRSLELTGYLPKRVNELKANEKLSQNQ